MRQTRSQTRAETQKGVATPTPDVVPPVKGRKPLKRQAEPKTPTKGAKRGRKRSKPTTEEMDIEPEPAKDLKSETKEDKAPKKKDKAEVKDEEMKEETKNLDNVIMDMKVGSLEGTEVAPGWVDLEQGHLHFFYRPKVEHHQVTSLSDVARLYLLMCPSAVLTGGDARLLLLPKKRLPSPSSTSKAFAMVDRCDTVAALCKDLGVKEYDTRTRGQRTLEPARLLASATYGIFKHHGHVHLSYVLELPHVEGKIQHAFNIQHRGTFLFSVKNPLKGHASYLPPDRTSTLDAEHQDLFGDKKWLPVNPPTFLNSRNIELLLVGVKSDTMKMECLEEIVEAEEKMSEDTILKLDGIYDLIKKYDLPTHPLSGHWESVTKKEEAQS